MPNQKNMKLADHESNSRLTDWMIMTTPRMKIGAKIIQMPMTTIGRRGCSTALDTMRPSLSGRLAGSKLDTASVGAPQLGQNATRELTSSPHPGQIVPDSIIRLGNCDSRRL